MVGERREYRGERAVVAGEWQPTAPEVDADRERVEAGLGVVEAGQHSPQGGRWDLDGTIPALACYEAENEHLTVCGGPDHGIPPMVIEKG